MSIVKATLPVSHTTDRHGPPCPVCARGHCGCFFVLEQLIQHIGEYLPDAPAGEMAWSSVCSSDRTIFAKNGRPLSGAMCGDRFPDQYSEALAASALSLSASAFGRHLVGYQVKLYLLRSGIFDGFSFDIIADYFAEDMKQNFAEMNSAFFIELANIMAAKLNGETLPPLVEIIGLKIFLLINWSRGLWLMDNRSIQAMYGHIAGKTIRQAISDLGLSESRFSSYGHPIFFDDATGGVEVKPLYECLFVDVPHP